MAELARGIKRPTHFSADSWPIFAAILPAMRGASFSRTCFSAKSWPRSMPAAAPAASHCEAFGFVNKALGYGVETLDGDIAHTLEVRYPQIVLIGQMLAKIFRVNFDGAQATKH